MKKIPDLLLATVLFSSLQAVGGRLVFSEAFDTDPFGNGDRRFEQTLEQYGFVWLPPGSDFRPEINGPGNPNGPALNLPLGPANALYAFSRGNITLKSLDARPLPECYTESIEFEISGDERLSDIAFGFGDARSIYIGGNHCVARVNADKTVGDFTTAALKVNERYRLQSSVAIQGNSVKTNLQIVRKHDNITLWNWDWQEIPAERLNRRQLDLSLPGTDGRYWTQTVMIDNWQIETSENK